jgi:hypothetical protein
MHNKETFIEYLRERVDITHLDFTKTKYVNRLTPLTITCKIHGDFIKKVTYVKYPKNSGKIGICPRCTVVQRELDRNKTGHGSIYLIKLSSDTEEFYKLGYTQYKIDKRFNGYNIPKEYTLELIASKYYSDPRDAIERELELHKKFKEYKYDPVNNGFYGYDECYSIDILELEEIISEGI